MASTDKVQPTRAERATAKLKARFNAHIQEWYPRENTAFPDRDYFFHIEDAPYQLWSCRLSNRTARAAEDETPTTTGQQGNAARTETTLWLLWDKSEVTSFDEDEVEEAFTDLINGQRARRLDSKLKQWTSPLAVSAMLALILCGLITFLEVVKYDVPNQLWSVFTAVVAFYFGRESSHSRAETTTED